MNKKMSKRQKDLKSKLMAAVCMLLVSSIMMVSTTYAWFTLSTAPEVTGITTAVGANGNLEMALLPENGDKDSIMSESGDSLKNAKERNITWGNLVDLSEDTVYGLDKVVLYPSALNVGADGKLTGALLKTPEYGADGRVTDLKANTVTGVYNGSFTPSENKGVRAVGVASGMTERELDYRNGRAAANSAMGLASSKAAQALNGNGSALASIAVKYGTGTTTFTGAELLNLNTIIAAFEGNDGILAQIEKAYLQFILAYGASSLSGDTDVAYTSIKGKVEDAGATLSSVVSYLTDDLSLSLPTALTDGINAYYATVTAVTEARSAYNNLGVSDSSTHEWTEIQNVVNALADANSMTVNDKTPSEVKNNLQSIIDDVTSGKGLTVKVATGGGVFADVADQCGDYFAQIRLEGISYGGLSLNANARMETKTNKTPPYLQGMSLAVENKAPASNTGEVLPISDFYGYVIDMAFRTNASESNLLLQADAVDRIYDQSGNEETMGHGATMTFQSTTTDFSSENVKGLMKGIRIVFFDPADGAIKAKAKLNADAATLGTDGWTAKMYLYTETAETSTENYTLASMEQKTAAQQGTDGAVELYTQSGTDGNLTYTKVEETSTIDVNNAYYVKTTPTVTPAGETVKTDSVIMPLNQNTPTALSCLVYLDGNVVNNGDVAATGSSSMTGTMNLQFASSANLVPMEYKDLHQGTPIGDNTNSPAATNMTAVTAAESSTAGIASASFVGSAVTIKLSDYDAAADAVTAVSVGGTPLDASTYTVAADGTITFTYNGVAANTAVVVTVGAKT